MRKIYPKIRQLQNDLSMAKLLIFIALTLAIFAFESNGAPLVGLAPFGSLSKLQSRHPWRPSRLNLKENEFHRQLRFVQPRIFSKPMEVEEQPAEVLISAIAPSEARKMREYMILRKI